MVYNMDTEAVRQLSMGLGLFFLVIGDTGSYRIIVWIVLYFQLDCIISSAKLYCIGCIVSYCIVWIRKRCFLCSDWLLAGWDGWYRWTGWGVVSTGVGRTDLFFGTFTLQVQFIVFYSTTVSYLLFILYCTTLEVHICVQPQ